MTQNGKLKAISVRDWVGWKSPDRAMPRASLVLITTDFVGNATLSLFSVDVDGEQPPRVSSFLFRGG